MIKKNIQERLTKLAEESQFYVGLSEVEMKEKKDRVDDALADYKSCS